MPLKSSQADREYFPSPRESTIDVIAIGNDLSVPVLMSAYRNGIFPWPVNEAEPIYWFSPRKRAILEHERLHVGRTLRRAMKKGWRVSFDEAFEDVIRACAEPRQSDKGGTWILSEMIEAYLELHRLGHAHSVEVWDGEELIAGLYGVDPGGAFCGESMFTRVSDASKVALVHLLEHLHERGVDWIDIQMLTPHLERLGARTIRRTMFLDRLAAALESGRALF